MTAPISNGPTTHGYTTMRDATGRCRRLCLLAVGETGVAFAGVVGAAHETGVAFAGVNGPVLGGWSRAVVSRVSNVGISGRAVVSRVSSASVGRRALVLWVSCRAVLGLVVVRPGVFVGRL